MFRCIPYEEAMRTEWDRIARQRGSVYHTVAFRHILLRSFGYRCLYHAVVDESGRIQALLPLIGGRNLAMKQAGVALPFINYLNIVSLSPEAGAFAVDAYKRLKSELGLGYVELRLKQQSVDEAQWSVNDRNYTFLLPLDPNEETVLARSSGSNRNHVRKVYKRDDFEVSFDPALLPDFYRVYVRRMKQLGSPATDLRYFQAFFEELPGETTLLSVLDKSTRELVGGMLLIGSRPDGILYYPYGANLIEYNNKYLNNFMYWEAVRFGIREGYGYLDLGRSPAGSGTYTFKEKWGAEPVPLRYLTYTGTTRKPAAPDQENMQLLIELWKKTPGFITEPLGKRLIKYLLP